MKADLFTRLALGSMLALLNLNASRAAVYLGNGDTSGGGAVGGGSVSFTDNGSTVYGTFTRGTTGSNPYFDYPLVFFIDSVPGGLHDTTTLTGTMASVRPITGYNTEGTSKSSVIFASGFNADYALVVSGAVTLGGLYQLSAGSMPQLVANVSTVPDNNQNADTFEFRFNWSDIGQPGTTGHSFGFESTYIDRYGYRFLESFENITGAAGYSTTTFGSYDTYPQADPVPEPTNVALAIFGLGLGAGGLLKLGRDSWRRKSRPA